MCQIEYKHILVLVMVGLFIMSCDVDYIDNKDIKSKKIIKKQPKKSIQQLKASVFSSGDVNDYEELKSEFEETFDESFLFYALIMANKFDYTRAYVDVFDVLLVLNSCETGNLDCLDEKTRTLALSYLKIAVERKNEYAEQIYSELD